MKEEKFFREGSKYFGKNFDELKDKTQYKQEYYLSTGIWWFRSKTKIEVYTSCIASKDYLCAVFGNYVKDLTIYYFDSVISISELETIYRGYNVKFIKLRKDPIKEFSHKTIIFCFDKTIIFDNKFLGVSWDKKYENRVYRDRSKRDFELYHERALKLI